MDKGVVNLWPCLDPSHQSKLLPRFVSQTAGDAQWTEERSDVICEVRKFSAGYHVVIRDRCVCPECSRMFR